MTKFLPSILWIVLVAAAGYQHLRALRRYRKLQDAARRLEPKGLVPEGTLLTAKNQTLRYWYRVLESIYALVLGVVGVIGIVYPLVAASPWTGLAVLAFLYVSVAVTGYLTTRDMRVLTAIEAIEARTTK